MPKIPINATQAITGLALQNKFKFNINTMQVPVFFELPSTGEKFTFPVDPLVSITTKNNVICKNVAKADNTLRGTIKEKWSMSDYEIKITGIFMSDVEGCVDDYIIKLRKFVEANESIKIICPYINDTYDITRIVITDLDMPFTQGEENQQFSISAKSDDERINLLV